MHCFINYRLASVNNPQADGAAEQVVRTPKRAFRKCGEVAPRGRCSASCRGSCSGTVGYAAASSRHELVRRAVWRLACAAEHAAVGGPWMQRGYALTRLCFDCETA